MDEVGYPYNIPYYINICKKMQYLFYFLSGFIQFSQFLERIAKQKKHFLYKLPILFVKMLKKEEKAIAIDEFYDIIKRNMCFT